MFFLMQSILNDMENALNGRTRRRFLRMPTPVVRSLTVVYNTVAPKPEVKETKEEAEKRISDEKARKLADSLNTDYFD